jgi:SAM-dependent methyltransferase
MAFLCFFMSLTDMNGLLGRGATFVFSLNQLQKLLDKAGITQSQYTNMLDIGAGDGSVTNQMKAMSTSRISVTEMSPTLQRTLRRKGYEVLDIEQWQRRAPFDWISMLNVLDRCDKPKTLLQDIYNCLTPNGLFLLSVVLPFDPVVLKGPWKVEPSETLPIEGGTFESSLNSLVNDILKPQGFRVLSWTRVPYFSEGDFLEPYYVLDNALLLLQRY